MARTATTVRVHDADDETFAALAQVLEVHTGDTATWVTIVDKTTDIEVTFFKSPDVEVVVSDAAYVPDDA